MIERRGCAHATRVVLRRLSELVLREWDAYLFHEFPGVVAAVETAVQVRVRFTED